MEDRVGLGEVRRKSRLRYLLALVAATLLGLGIGVPVFAQEEGEEPDIQPEVVGGTPVTRGTYPFMVSIQADTSGASPYREHFCGGSLIDRDSVLTAAHCADLIGRVGVSGSSVSYRDVRIVVGLTELNSDQGEARRIARFSDVSIHPRFNRRTFEYDAAVIKLASPVSIAPIKRAGPGVDRFERPGRLAKVAGWGNTVQQGPNFGQPDRFPNRMREAKVPIVSDTRAERVYGQGYFPPIMVGAGREGVDTCQGDSGGPMWSPTSAGPRQFGITSKGSGCGARGFPGVYAEVNAPAIRSFIAQAASR